MSLGIYDRLWDLLEGECTVLDLLLAEHTSPGGVGNTTFDQYVAALKKREELASACVMEEQRATLLEQLVTYFSLRIPNAPQSQQLKTLREEASKTRLGVNALVY